MGDARFAPYFARIREAENPAAEITTLTDEGVVMALAAASRDQDPYLANVLATEAVNRIDRLRAVPANLGEGVFALDPSGRIRYANAAAAALLDVGIDELEGQTFHDLVHPEHANPHEAGVPCRLAEIALARAVERSDEDVFITKSGTAIPVAWTVSPVLRENNPEGAVVIVHDVQERKRAEEMLIEQTHVLEGMVQKAFAEVEERKASEARLQSFFEAMPDALVLVDARGAITFANEQTTRMFGRSPETLLGEQLEILIPSRFHEAHTAHVERFMEDPHQRPMGVGLELFGIRADGTEFPIEVGLSPIESADGPLVLATVRDVTERSRAERALRDSEGRWRALVENAGSIIATLDLEGRVLFVNRKAGNGVAPVVGRIAQESFVASTDAGRLRDAIARVARTRKPAKFEVLARSTANAEQWFQCTLAPMGDGEKVEDLLLVATDITDQKRVERTLQENEERFRTVFNEGPVGVAIVGTDFRFIRVNRAFTTMLGYGPAELEGRKFADVTHPEDVALDENLAQLLFEGRIPSYRIEKRYLSKVGGVIWVDLTAAVVRDKAGGVKYALAVVRDITSERRAQDALRESQELLARIVETVPDGIAILEADGSIAFANGAAENIGGRPRQALIGQPFDAESWGIRDTQGRPLSLHARFAAVSTGVLPSDEIEVSLQRADGERVFVTATAVGLPGKGTEARRILASFKDVTERRRVESQIVASEARYRQLAENSGDMISLHDHQGVFTYVSTASAIVVGYDPDELVGVPLSAFCHPEEADALTTALAQAARTDERVVASYRFRTKDGAYRWLESTCRASQSDGEGPRLGPPVIHVISRDVTKRREDELAIRRLNETLEARVAERTRELEVAVNELESFSYSVAHDLRAPLRAIDVLLDALVQDHGSSLDDDARELTKRSRSQAKQLSKLVSDLLDFSRAGSTEIRREDVDVTALAREILAELQSREPMRRVDVAVAEGLRCLANEALMRVVFQNLLGNAWKFTRDRPRARIEVGEEDTPDGRAIFVMDNGVGFSPKDADRVFRPFQRLPSSAGFEGHGIGLATVARIIGRHNGWIRAEAAPGEGAKFRLRMTAGPDSAHTAHAPPSPANDGGSPS